jgi:cell division protease FtsH
MATGWAKRMVTEYGMSEKLGRVRYSSNEQEVFLGHSVTQTQNMSEATAETIDSEVRRIIETAEVRAHELLSSRIDDVHKLAKALLEFETLSGDEVNALLRGEEIVRPAADDPPPTTKPGGRRGSVPSSGGGKPAGGFDPQPQPGA